MAALEFSFSIDTRSLKRFTRKFPKTVRRGVLFGMQVGLQKFKQKFIRERLSGPPGVTSRSGAIARATRTRVRETKRLYMAEAYIDGGIAPHAITQEVGAEIRPVRAQLLKIPLTHEARTRDFPKGSLRLIGKRRLFLVPKDGGPPLFVLKDRVVIKPRLGFRSTFRKSVPIIIAETRRSVQREVDKELRR